ncbi:tRNA (N(6)-L-threonylcarbamoyladenosine(37)-C(2))-methylthiotransferase MtaB [Neglectibacter caecimuris]|uniref:tRNA (N(6)-L-threonylcarbamoyladenosine(37)-C(2))- methylthiotransferase MtaB n=1 Tax=Neglectibacter caecimuris TaxID=3093658 RepID=UPI002AC8C546|nr:tRNA (N(6)-L-threonylcarbamoyladenosine(37)-C(2))-methylthiotransferase MtaB [Neglectibacter sp. M00184]
MKVKFITLGCKVNQYESEAMLELLLREGFQEAADGEEADVVVVNSCTVTATGDQKARQALRRAKKQNPGAVAVLTGCWPQAFPGEAAEFQEADIVLGTKNRAALLPHILSYFSHKQRIVDIAPHEAGEKFEAMRVSSFHGRTRAFLKIEDGCNRFCSYCIIPYARGRVRSKPLSEIRAEVRSLAAHDYREVVLTGINLPAYGQDLGLHLCDAVEAACEEPEIRRVRLGSLEPEQLTEEVIARLQRQKKLCPQFHLSLQSGCDETLRRMNRHYTTAEYRQIVKNLRAAFPGCAITTDIMVGFAGETEEEFQTSLNFAKEIAFAKVHVFAYSRRPGTKAYTAPDQVPEKVKEERSRVMIAVTLATQRAFLRAQVGNTEEVLFEQAADKNVYEGYTGNYTLVRAVSPMPLHGQLLPVQITEAGEGFCLGEIRR